MNSTRYQLGGFNDKNIYYLYPHYSDYFSQVFSQFQSLNWNQYPHLSNICQAVHNIIHDIQKGNILYFEEFQAIVSKVNSLEPQNWNLFTSLVILLQNGHIRQIKSQKTMQIQSYFYTLFGGLSLGKYLQGLNTNIIVTLSLPKMRLIDGNIDKLSRLDIPNLGTLVLESNEITVEGIKMIVKNNNWKMMRHLNLNRNLINNEGLKQLTRAEWKYLKKLWLEGNLFGDTGVDNWTYLQDLDLRSKRNDVTSIFHSARDERSVQCILQKAWKNLNSLKIYICEEEVLCDSNSKLRQKLLMVL